MQIISALMLCMIGAVVAAITFGFSTLLQRRRPPWAHMCRAILAGSAAAVAIALEIAGLIVASNVGVDFRLSPGSSTLIGGTFLALPIVAALVGALLALPVLKVSHGLIDWLARKAGVI